MRLIPRNTKVQTSLYKGITIADVILGLVGLGLDALALASNLPYRLLIALGIACLFIPLFIPVGEERIYKCALYLARHIFSRKKYTEKGKDAANIQSIIPYERIDGNCIVNKDGGFTGVLEIKPIEFRLLGANKQNYLIDGVLTNVLTGVGASQEAAIVKLEKPLDFDKHIQADLQRIVALAEANENGNLSDGEYAARIDVIQDRLALVDTLNTEQQVKYSCYYIAVTDRNKTSLMATLSVMRGTLLSGSIEAKILKDTELAEFIALSKKLDGTGGIAAPREVAFRLTSAIQDDRQLSHFVITGYPLKVPNAWGEELFDLPNTKVVMKLKPVEKFKALKRIDTAIMELSTQAKGKASKIIDKTTHVETLSALLARLQNDNEVLYETELIGDGDWSLARSEAAAQFGTYFSIGDYGGDLMVYTDYDENIDKYVTEIMPYYMAVTNANRTGRYKLGFALYGTQGDEINMYTDSFTEFIDNDDPAYTAGTPDGSINEMATGREAISVGANVTKKTWKVFGKDGVASYPNDPEVIGNMASFSSYGYDLNGVWHPTIVAPGYVISSSLNRYNYGISYSDMTNTITSMVTSEDGNTSYYWGINSGTSMATPAVTGIIATWLQYDPTLTPDDIKDIFAHTAQKPETYGNVNPLQWGPNGIIDAYAGLAYMGAVGVNDVTKAQDMVLVYPNPTGGQFKVFAQGEEQVELSIYNMGGTKVYGHTYTTTDGNFDVDLQGSLPAGIYVLQLRGDRQNYSTKLVIK